MDFAEELSKFEVNSKEYKFFEIILKKLGPNFICESTAEKKREVHNQLNVAMQNYFQSHIFVTAIIKASEQIQEIDQLSSTVSPVYLNFMKKRLTTETDDKLKLYGLSQEIISKTVMHRNPELQTVEFKKLIEDNIQEFCKNIILCTGGTITSTEDWRNELDRTIKGLESKATLLSSEEIMQQSEKRLRDMIKTYYEELSTGVLLLNKILSLHLEKLEFESNLSKFYFLRCHAVFLKIRLFELKMLEASYNKETIPALKKISEQLDQREQKLKEEKNEKEVALEQYLKLGEEYESFVDEYTQLIKNIKEQQWAIDELKSRNSKYAASGHD